MNVAVVTPQMVSGERGGAEAFYDGFIGALRAAGHEARQIPVPTDESCFDAVLESYERCYALDLHEYDLVVSTKAPTFMLSHPNHVSYFVHTLRVFYDMFDAEYGVGTADQHAQRRVVHALDRFGLRPGRVRRHFSIGQTACRRLGETSPWWKQVAFRTLHPVPVLQGFGRPRGQDYIFVPGRLHRWKRVDLLIEAYRHVKRKVPMIIAGTGEDARALHALAAGDPRIRFVGHVSESALLDLYANALLVAFVPKAEDYGFITIEALKSGKAVLTCTDSGEPLEFVRDGHNGYVSEPHPLSLARRLTHAIDHPRRVAVMGQRGAKSVAHIAWEPIVDALVGPVRFSSRSRSRRQRAATPRRQETFRTAVLDMQPIDPPVGGGRLRLLGLYHNLGPELPTRYVGTYDWPGESYRCHRLSPSLEEIDVPLTPAHFAAAADWSRRAGGQTIIDSAFSHLAHHSPEFVDEACMEIQRSDVVVFSHPWVYPLVKELLCRRRQLIVYDAQNVEGLLRCRLLGDTPFGADIARHAAVIERDLVREADLVLACSHEDRLLFHELYGVPFAKCLVVPNGTFTDAIVPASGDRRAEAKRALGLPPGPMAMFIGSPYPPNVEAARFISGMLASSLPAVTFVICGGVGEALEKDRLAPNVRVTRAIAEADKRQYLEAADAAVNPMFTGSGTNIKLFDFMAAGLPVVTTSVGARGCPPGSERSFLVAAPDDFATMVQRVLDDAALAAAIGAAGRRFVSERYSWERISPTLGRLLHRNRSRLGTPRPAVSVVVPTYERQAMVEALMECLAAQTMTDFEVIVVDQSAAPWQPRWTPPFDLMYVHTDVRGAGKARNAGALYARGDVLAFTDDDCRPDADWLENGLRYFRDPSVVGVEGSIVSDRAHDERYRAVTNAGFEGIGFMTANLWLRREIFSAIDGFDVRFDDPIPFREDTDVAWRALEHGAIPFGADVRVYHPPQRRAVDREASATRVRFFENDALLFKKHPERYRKLFLRERHFARTAGFLDHFRRGAAKHGVEIDDFFVLRCNGGRESA